MLDDIVSGQNRRVATGLVATLLLNSLQPRNSLVHTLHPFNIRNKSGCIVQAVHDVGSKTSIACRSMVIFSYSCLFATLGAIIVCFVIREDVLYVLLVTIAV
jgi:hypothetical protein